MFRRRRLQSGYEVQRLPTGDISQAGVRRAPLNEHHNPQNTQGWITPAVILQTYYADEDDRNGWVAGKQRCMLSDVRTIGRYTRVLSKVPHLQMVHGLWDEDFRTPRGATIHLGGGELVSEPTSAQGPTPSEQTDGDHVVVAFLDNDPEQPVILPWQVPHPQAGYTPKAADGRVRRIRHNGVLVEIDAAGNVTIDARGAAKPELGPGGAEQSNSGVGGKVMLRTTDGSNETSLLLDAQGRILFGGAPGAGAADPITLGNELKSIMGDLRTAIQNLKLMTAWGPTIGPPLNLAEFEAAFSRFDANEHSSDFIFGKKTY